MKKLLVLLATVALTTTATLAQTTTEPVQPTRSGPRGAGRAAGLTPEQRAERQTQRLTRELNLSASQTTQVQTLLLTQQQEVDALRTQPAPDRRTAMQTLRAKYDAQLTTLLTPEQRTRYTQLRDERGQKQKEKGKDGKLKMKTQS